MGTRLQRENTTVQAMIRLACGDRHQSGETLCPDCARLAAYAERRLDACPFGNGKTTCSRCPVHCYKPEMREKIRQVMRYAGPRMPWRHPILAIRHLLDGRRKIPRPQGESPKP